MARRKRCAVLSEYHTAADRLSLVLTISARICGLDLAYSVSPQRRRRSSSESPWQHTPGRAPAIHAVQWSSGPVQESGMRKGNVSLTISSFHRVVFALSLVQYLTCNVPALRPGKNSAICFHVKFLDSFSLTSSASSSRVNLSFGPFGLGAGSGIPSFPTILGGPGSFKSSSSPCLVLLRVGECGGRWW